MVKLFTDVQNSAGLIAALNNIDAAVPARTKGRKSHHRETYNARHLLLAIADRLSFPVSACRRDPPNDRPDVVLRTGTGQIGIEITEAIPKGFAALSALAERENFPAHCIPLDPSAWELDCLTEDELREVLRGYDPGSSPGWSGYGPEEKWASFMSEVVKKKLRKLAGDGFQLFDENWLFIYSNNIPVPPIHLAEAIELLKPLVADIWAAVPKFDALFIEYGPVIARVTATASEHLVIGDPA